MHELAEKYEQMKESLADLHQKKAKLEAKVEMSQKKLGEIDAEIREKLGIEPEELEDWIDTETAKAEKHLEDLEKAKLEAKQQLAEIEAKIRGDG